MILSFCCKETQKIFLGEKSRKFPLQWQRIALRKLVMIHAAVQIEDLRIPPANRLEQLKGKRKEQWSIHINKQWRICFTWQNGNAFDVEIIDYHS
jgi:proteic killer suppression protein